MEDNRRSFDLQLFAEEYTIDQAVEILSGTQQTEQVETTETEQAEQTEQIEQQEPETQEEETEQPEQTPAVDYNLKVKFKANGQEVEKSIQDLINEAQLASNYNVKMQELANQRKAFDAAMQQQQPKDDPAKTFEELNNKITERAMKMLGITDPAQFEPDALGIMGSKVHYAAYQKALLDIQQEEQSLEHAKQEQQAVEQHYVNTMQTYAKEANFMDVNKYAEQALFLLPQSGAEGITEFNELYGIYQNLKLRDQQWLEVQQFGRSNIQIPPLTRKQVDKLTSFYEKCKGEYTAKQSKEQVKAQVPKSVPIKPTVKVEEAGNNDPAPARKKVDADFLKKIREMDIDQVAKTI